MRVRNTLFVRDPRLYSKINQHHERRVATLSKVSQPVRPSLRPFKDFAQSSHASESSRSFILMIFGSNDGRGNRTESFI